MHGNAPLFLLSRFCRGVIELFAPQRCRVCGLPLWGHDNPFLCAACAGEVRWIGSGACRRCGYPAGEFAAWPGGGCPRCRGRSLGMAGVAAVARYRGGARELVRALKFRDERRLAPAMGALMAERWPASGMKAQVDLVVPVPLHPGRLRFRGFNQSALLAEALAERLGLELCADSLKRVKATRPQAFLRRAERLRTMEGAFAAGGALRGRTVLLVDDVLTTGSTMSAAAKACRDAGAKRVCGIAFAR